MSKLLRYDQAMDAIRQSSELQKLQKVYVDRHEYTCLEPGGQVASDGYALVWLEHQMIGWPGSPLRMRGLLLEGSA